VKTGYCDDMRIAYIFHLIDGPESGVFKKIVDQSRQWIKYGADPSFFILTREEQAESFIDASAGIPAFVYEYRGIAERLKKVSQLYTYVLNYSVDLVYYRYDIYYPSFVEFAKQVPVVMEINADDISEFRLGNRFRHWFNYFTRRHILSNVAGLIFESHQLAESPHFTRFGKPCLAIGNSINLERFPELPAPENPCPVVVFLGLANQPWQGVEKVLWLARHLKKWRFELIGSDLSNFNGIPSNVVIHGFMNQLEYEPLLAKADAGIGPLSLYLAGKVESSPLKVREYLAYGLPTILGYRDTDFPDGAPFLLQIGGAPDNVMNNIAEIEKFVLSWQGKRVPRDMVNLLDVSVKEEKRLMFLSRIAEGANER
jgi:glycosyltransferase involved in cell wall biosynthesis